MLSLIFVAFSVICFMMMITYKLPIVRYAIVLIGLIVVIIKRKELMKFGGSTVVHFRHISHFEDDS